MTTIGAIRAREREADRYKDYFVFFADSMVSYSDNQNQVVGKADNTQKLFKVGDYLIAPSGNLQIALGAIEQLRGTKHTIVNDAARQLRDYLQGLDGNDITRFLIAGSGKTGLQLLQVGAFPEHNVPDPIIREGSFIFDGSGGPHAQKRFDSYFDRQLIGRAEVADILSFAHEFGVRGAQNVGANDKMQYGIVSEDGISLLYHPDINLETDEHLAYLELMTRVPQRAPRKGKTPEDLATYCSDILDIWDTAVTAGRLVSTFFHSLSHDLAAYTDDRSSYAKWSDSLMHNECVREVFEKTLQKTRNSRENLEHATRAFAHKGIPAILEYLEGYNRRRDAMQDQARTLYDATQHRIPS